MLSIVCGRSNSALGPSAFFFFFFGIGNVAIGTAALYSTVYNYNVGIGSSAWRLMSGTHNLVLGYQAGWGTASAVANNNVIIGDQAGYSIDNASHDNVLIGYHCADNIGAGATENVYIGYDIDLQNATGSNQMSIGNLLFSQGIDGTGTDVSTGNLGVGIIDPDARVEIESPAAGTTVLHLKAAASPTANILDITDSDDVSFVSVAADGLTLVKNVIRGTTSLWWHSMHAEISSINPGGSGATWVPDDANTAGGWQLNADTEILEVRSDAHSDWDGASDIEVKIVYEVNVNNTEGGEGDTVDFKVVAHYKGVGDVACKTQTQEEACIVGQSAQYKQFTCTITLNWDETDNVIEVGDKITFQINLETDTSEVEDVIVNHVHTRYKTAQIGPEV